MFGNASAWGAPAAVPVAAAVPAPPANPTIKKFKELRRFYSHDKAAPGAAAPVAPSLYGAAAAPAAPAARIINPDCKFIEIHYDSNEGDPTAPVKPSFVEQAAWDAALQDNPDTVKMNPQAVVGIKNLKSRADIIKEQRLAYQDTVGRVSSGLEAVKRKIQKNKVSRCLRLCVSLLHSLHPPSHTHLHLHSYSYSPPSTRPLHSCGSRAWVPSRRICACASWQS